MKENGAWQVVRMERGYSAQFEISWVNFYGKPVFVEFSTTFSLTLKT